MRMSTCRLSQRRHPRIRPLWTIRGKMMTQWLSTVATKNSLKKRETRSKQMMLRHPPSSWLKHKRSSNRNCFKNKPMLPRIVKRRLRKSRPNNYNRTSSKMLRLNRLTTTARTPRLRLRKENLAPPRSPKILLLKESMNLLSKPKEITGTKATHKMEAISASRLRTFSHLNRLMLKESDRTREKLMRIYLPGCNQSSNYSLLSRKEPYKNL